MRVVRRDIKYPRIELRTGMLTLILPHGDHPQRLLNKYQGWIEKKQEFIRKALNESDGKRMIKRSQTDFRELIADLVAKNGQKLKLRPAAYSYRLMWSKWASCSARGRLTLNTLMQYLPTRLIDYILFHEMHHLDNRKHNGEFWRTIGKRFPNYQKLEHELFVYWFLVQRKSNEIKTIS